MELLAPSCCPACDAPRRPGEPLLCEPCALDLEPRERLGAAHTAIEYAGTGARLVQRFKFERRRDALAVLASLLCERVYRLRFDAIVPVPRHPGRIREQGCEPTYDLARRLGRDVGVAVLDHVLRRTRATPPQLGLPPEERRRNVDDAFRARRHSLGGRRVLLLDDVVTTGATLEAAGRALSRYSGASAVLPVAVAGTPPLPIVRSGAL